MISLVSVALLLIVGASCSSSQPVRIPVRSSGTCSSRLKEEISGDITAAIESIVDSNVTSRFVPPVCGENG